MHRVGADAATLAAVADAVAEAPGLRLRRACGRTWPWPRASRTPTTGRTPSSSCAASTRPRAVAGGTGIVAPVHHLANSAGAIAHPAARLDLVRCGIALYGEAPSPAVGDALAAELGGGAPRAAPGDDAAGPGLVRAGACPPGPGPPTAGAGPCPRRPPWSPCPSATPTASPGAPSTREVRCSSAAGPAPWRGRSPWTRSWWTAALVRRSRWATRSC